MLLKWTRSYGRFLDLLPHLLLMVPALISFCSFPLHYSRKISASSMSLFTQFKLANATFSALHIGLLFLLFYLSCKKCKCWNFAHFYPSSYHRVWAVGQTLGKMANKGGTAWSMWERGWWYLKWRQRAGSDISSCLVKEEEEEGSCESIAAGNHTALQDRVRWWGGKNGGRGGKRCLDNCASAVRLKAAVLGDKRMGLGGIRHLREVHSCSPEQLKRRVRLGCQSGRFSVSTWSRTKNARQGKLVGSSQVSQNGPPKWEFIAFSYTQLTAEANWWHPKIMCENHSSPPLLPRPNHHQPLSGRIPNGTHLSVFVFLQWTRTIISTWLESPPSL